VQNGRTDRNAVCGTDLCGSRNLVLDGSRSPYGKGLFYGISPKISSDECNGGSAMRPFAKRVQMIERIWPTTVCRFRSWLAPTD